MSVDLSFGRYDGPGTTHVIFVLYLDDATFIFQEPLSVHVITSLSSSTLGRLTCVIFSCIQWSRTNCSLGCSTLSISASSSSLVSWFICMKGNLMGKSKLGHSRVTWTKSSFCIPLVTSVKTESNRFCGVFNMSGTLWTFNSLNVTLYSLDLVLNRGIFFLFSLVIV